MFVSGVTVLKGQEEIEIYAPVVISNAGIFNTFEKFLPQPIQEKPGNTALSLQPLNKLYLALLSFSTAYFLSFVNVCVCV